MTLVLSIMATLCLGFYAAPLCRRFGLMDEPDDRKQHDSATPMAGGLALILVVLPLFVALSLLVAPVAWRETILVATGATAAMTLLGLADDRHTLSARDRLVLSLLIFVSAALIDNSFTVRLLAFEHPALELGLGTTWFSAIFTMVCGVGLVNAVNMADGKNGLVIGLLIGWMALLALRAPEPLLPLLLIMIAVLTILFLFNMRGRLFLGDGGAYGFACLAALLTIATYNHSGVHAKRAISADEIMLLFSVPVLDSFRLTALRLRRGLSPMAADRNHLHDIIEARLGWGVGLWVYLAVALAPAALVFVLV